ncbi:ABC transporter ATP-binding protein/permease [Candidatus Pelagibacter ubique]|nr:ABC transporter ATP-binding protein/permease [Candidatus Pelagibacter ubique]
MKANLFENYKQSIQKITYILGEGHKKNIIIFIILMFMNTIFELLSLGAFMPILLVLFDENFLQNKILISVLPLDFLISKNNLLIFFVLLLSGIYIVKSVFQIYFNHFRLKLVSGLQINLINDLYKRYIFQEYSFVTHINSPTIVRNLTGEVNGFVSRVLIPLINILIDFLTVFFVLISLMFFEPLGSLIMLSSILLFSFLFYFATKNKISNLGLERQDLELKRLREIQESFKIFREIKLLSLEKFTIQNFNIYNSKVYKLFKKEALIATLPKILFELIIVILLSLIIMLFIKINYDSKQIITILSIFTLAAVKLLPIFNKILISFQQINFGLPYLNITYTEFKKYQLKIIKNNSDEMSFKESIIFKAVNFNYGEKNLFKNLNLKIKKGDITHIKGPSGSGKTTFLDLLSGLLKPNSGDILVDNKNINNNLRMYQGSITYIPQTIYLLDDTIRANITLGQKDQDIDMDKLKKCLELSCLNDFIKSLKYGVYSQVGENGIKISGGQKQRIGIARGFYLNSDIIILDEATNAIDLDTVEKIYKNISTYAKNKTILVTSHHDYFDNFFNNKIDIGNLND